MREKRKFKASHFENIQELIASCIIWIKTDDYDAYCRFFDMGAMEELIKELNNLKEIEKSHQEENGKLRVELEQEKASNKFDKGLYGLLMKEKEKNKELNEALERSSGRVTELTVENSDLKYQIYHKQQMIDELTQNEENLKIELGKEKEKNKEIAYLKSQIPSDKIFYFSDKDYISKDKIRQEIKNIEKRMETATNSTEYQKLHCAQEYLRGLLWEV